MSRKDVTDLQVCRAYELWRAELQSLGAGARRPTQLLQEWTDEPLKVCWRAMERACGRGLVEYGTSLDSGWLTEKGKRVIAEAA